MAVATLQIRYILRNYCEAAPLPGVVIAMSTNPFVYASEVSSKNFTRPRVSCALAMMSMKGGYYTPLIRECDDYECHHAAVGK